MMGGAHSEAEIIAARDEVVDQYWRLRQEAKQVPKDDAWRMFHAGAVCMLIHKMNTQLTRFLVAVSDD